MQRQKHIEERSEKHGTRKLPPNDAQPKGYTVIDDADKADVILFYEYGIGDPKVYTSERVVPIWGQTGISLSRTDYKTDYRGNTYAETTHTPEYGVVDSNVVTDTKTTYLRWVNMSAFDVVHYRKTGEGKMH